VRVTKIIICLGWLLSSLFLKQTVGGVGV